MLRRIIVDQFNNTYKTVRLIGPGYNLMYAVWCTNEHELYDMTVSSMPSTLIPVRKH